MVSTLLFLPIPKFIEHCLLCVVDLHVICDMRYATFRELVPFPLQMIGFHSPGSLLTILALLLSLVKKVGILLADLCVLG